MLQDHADTLARTAVVTGASAGIGLAVATALVRDGWRVIALGRDPARSASALDGLRAAALGAQVDMILVDLSVMAQVARAADEIAVLTGRIDLLVNNAGGIPAERVETADGLEACFAGNHLGPFLLTQRLLPLLRAASPGARIVNLASIAHRFVPGIFFDDLQLQTGFTPGKAYGQAKLANILFTRTLAKRVAADGIVVNAVHPGVVASNFGAHGTGVVRIAYRLMAPFILSSEQAADTVLWLGTAPETAGLTGGYYQKRKPAKATAAARDDVMAERLWTESERLVAQIVR
jgi:retinol dehydrogenase-12